MTTNRSVSGWAVGWTMWAALWMWILGSLHALAGFVGILEDEIFLVTPEYIFQLDTTTWGWIHLILGTIVFIAGFAIYNGAVWSRTVAVILAAISIVANFAWLPYYPVWGLIMITANVFVIWAVTVHGNDIAAT